MNKKIVLIDFLKIESFISPALDSLLPADCSLISYNKFDSRMQSYNNQPSAVICFVNDGKMIFSEELGKVLSFCLRHNIRNILVMVNSLLSTDARVLRGMNICSIASMSDSVDDLRNIIRQTLNGRMAFSDPSDSDEWSGVFKQVSFLTVNERDVIGSLMDGMSVTEIAFRRQLSSKTISAHKCNAMRKLGLRKKYDFLKLKRSWFY